MSDTCRAARRYTYIRPNVYKNLIDRTDKLLELNEPVAHDPQRPSIALPRHSRADTPFRVAGVEIFPGMQLKAENQIYQGRHKYVREVKSRAEYSADERLVRVEQTIDRKNDSYRKKVTVVDTGEILRKAAHPLSKHTGHGSDKPR